MRMGKLTGLLAGFGIFLTGRIPSVLAQEPVYCGNDFNNPRVNTALGCIPVDVGAFVQWLLPYLFGIAGGISFLLLVYGFILLTVSGGDAKAAQGAKETITSSITGLLISIFSLFILRLITVNILHIPGIN